MAVEVEVFKPGADIPCTVGDGDSVRGMRAVEFVPGAKRQVTETVGASTRFAGVARQDIPGVTEVGVQRNRVAVARKKPCRVIGSGAGDAGDLLVTAAGGTFAVAGATPAAGTVVGRAHEPFADGAVFEADLF